MAKESAVVVVAPVAPAETQAPQVVEQATAENISDTETKADAGEQKPPRTYTQEEMDKIAAKIKKNERYRTKKEVEAYYQGRESVAPVAPKAPEAPVVEKTPVRDDYPDYESFVEAKAAHAGKVAAREERVNAERQAKAEAEHKTRTEKIQTFQSKVAEKYPDLNERLEPIAHVVMPDGVAEALAESAVGPDILNHFAENTKDFERLASLSPSAALREIGKLEARFESATPAAPATAAAPTASTQAAPVATPVRKPSSAPAPVKPVGGTAVLGDGEPSHNDPEAWALWRNKQLLKKRTGT